MTKRVLVVIVAALLLAAGAAMLLRPPRGVPGGAPTISEMATDVGGPIVELLVRGDYEGRSGDIIAVPKPHSYLIGRWDYRSLGTSEPWLNTSHPNPWNYITRIPIIMSGPGVPEGVTDDTPVDIASIAPSYAKAIGFDGLDSAAEALPGVFEGEGKPPKVVLTVVIDGGGWNLLAEHPQSWPTLARLMDEGTTFTNATIGSAPSITGALHATFGTGVYPNEHGITGNVVRTEDDEIVDAYLEDSDPSFLLSPTVSELWDEANDNEPLVGTVSYEGWHLGMIGHGAQRDGGDKDLGAIWSTEDDSWWINEDYYTFPGYLSPTDIGTLEAYEEALDPRDGLEDGSWYGHSLETLREDLVRPSTPAYARFTGDAVAAMLENEDWGKDDLTDFLWVEMKAPDTAGHTYNMIRPEVGDVLSETDAQIARMMDILDKKVGRDGYVIAISADHGQQPLADLNGGWRISMPEVANDIEERFGDVVQKVTTADLYLDREALADSGYTTTEIARFLGTYTIGENITDGAPGADRVPEGRLDERVFAGAFPASFLRNLTPERIESFGPGVYPESDLTIPFERLLVTP